jgi:O-antigen ligase
MVQGDSYIRWLTPNINITKNAFMKPDSSIYPQTGRPLILSQSFSKGEKVISYKYFLPILLIGIYLVFLPTGYLGLLITIAAFLIQSLSASNMTLGVCSFLCLRMVFGPLFDAFGINNIPGAPVAFLLGLAFFSMRNPYQVLSRGRGLNALLIFLYVSLLMLLFYLTGPQSEYSLQKLLSMVIGIALAFYPLFFLVNSESFNTRSLGILSIISAVILYSVVGYINPLTLPDSIFVPTGVRFVRSSLHAYRDYAELYTPTIAIGYLASFGIACLLCALGTKGVKKSHAAISIVWLLIGYAVVVSAGQRLYIFIPLVVLIALVLSSRNKENGRYYRILLIVYVALLSISISYAYTLGSERLSTKLFDSSSAIGINLNRAQNFEAALQIIFEKPFFGEGLGGYFIEGLSTPGEGMFPHNLFLELLSELGVVGSIMLLFPFVLFIKSVGVANILSLRITSGALLLPIPLFYFLSAMIDNDLRYSFILFALFFVLWAYSPIACRFGKANRR